MSGYTSLPDYLWGQYCPVFYEEVNINEEKSCDKPFLSRTLLLIAKNLPTSQMTADSEYLIDN